MIGIYAHHHGAGHRRRADTLALTLAARGHETHVLGTGQPPGPARTSLPLDVDADGRAVDAVAGGRFHWAPLHDAGLRTRMAQLAAWVDREHPEAMVVDVSVEVAVFVRLMGVPIIVMAQPGRRDDAAHDLGYATASAIVAPWPRDVDAAPHLKPHLERVHHVGGLSRFAAGPDQQARPVALRRVEGTHGLLLSGRDGFDDPRTAGRIRAARPDVDWTEAGGSRWVDDIDHELRCADVVVTHAGQNSLADVAAHGIPAVVVPQARPWDEQVTMAEAIGRARIAVVVSDPARADWFGAVSAALAMTPQWHRWQTDGAWERAVDVIEDVARRGAA